MGNKSLILGVGTASVTAVLLLLFTWSKDSTAAVRDSFATESLAAISTDSGERLIRVVLATPYAQ
jgi:hypothetical protein